MNKSKNLLIIFVKNLVLGKVKSRLAEAIGEEKALSVYKYLCGYTREVTQNIQCQKKVFYSDYIENQDIWENSLYEKTIQIGGDLGERMLNAFNACINKGYHKIVLIGSDNVEINEEIIESAFDHLEENDLVFGPAEDGGYYLLGMKKMKKQLFSNKQWSCSSVLKDSLADCKSEKLYLLPTLNDVDTQEDLLRYADFHDKI